MSEIDMFIILIPVIAKTLQWQVESNKAQEKKNWRYSLGLFKVDHNTLNKFLWF